MAVFKKIWPDVWSARMEYILSNAVLALLDVPGATLLGIMRLLSEKEYRKKVISQVKDPVVKAFWVKEFASYQTKFATEAVAPIQNKVGQFLSSSVIRNIIAQVKSTIDIRKVMDEGKILIMNLSKGKIGEDSSHLLGGMLISRIQLSAMERVDMKEEDRRDFYLYVDEFQNFATESFADILSEARKYKLNLIVAHQFIAQLDETVRDAIFGNVGTHILFRVGAADASAFEDEFAPVFTPEDLVNVPKWNIYLKLMIDGAASQPFSASTLPPIGSPTGSYDKVIKVSRERYGQKRADIEEKIERWWGFDEEGGMEPEKPSSSYGRSSYSKREMFPATCSRCNKQTQAPFKPDPNRPFYCQDCLPIIKEKMQQKTERPRRSSMSSGFDRGDNRYDSRKRDGGYERGRRDQKVDRERQDRHSLQSKVGSVAPLSPKATREKKTSSALSKKDEIGKAVPVGRDDNGGVQKPISLSSLKPRPEKYKREKNKKIKDHTSSLNSQRVNKNIHSQNSNSKKVEEGEKIKI